MNMKDKIAVVTGAASGIGRATAQLLAEAGARVVVADIDAVNGEAAAAELRKAGWSAVFLPVDMTQGRIDRRLRPGGGGASSAPSTSSSTGQGGATPSPSGKARPSCGTSSSR